MKPPIIAAVLFAVLLGVVAYLAVSWWGTDSAPSEANPPPPPVLRDDAFVPLTAEAGRPRFVGELLGLFLAPSPDQYPAQLKAERDRLLAGGCVSVPTDQAAALAFPKALPLPGNFVPSPETPVAVACSGQVTGLNYEYSGTAANGFPATITIGRSVSRAWGLDAARDRVAVVSILDTQVIMARPENRAIAQTAQVIIPESFGLTSIYSFSLNETELREVAAAVIAASQ